MELPETESKSQYRQLRQENILEQSYKETSLYSTIRVQGILATRLQLQALNVLAPCSSPDIEACRRTCLSVATVESLRRAPMFLRKS